MIDKYHYTNMYLGYRMKYLSMFHWVQSNGGVNDDSTATFVTNFRVIVENWQTAEFDSQCFKNFFNKVLLSRFEVVNVAIDPAAFKLENRWNSSDYVVHQSKKRWSCDSVAPAKRWCVYDHGAIRKTLQPCCQKKIVLDIKSALIPYFHI